eukprot:362835-Chlamydomonas_euryale.AAC.9
MRPGLPCPMRPGLPCPMRPGLPCPMRPRLLPGRPPLHCSRFRITETTAQPTYSTLHLVCSAYGCVRSACHRDAIELRGGAVTGAGMHPWMRGTRRLHAP